MVVVIYPTATAIINIDQRDKSEQAQPIGPSMAHASTNVVTQQRRATRSRFPRKVPRSTAHPESAFYVGVVRRFINAVCC